MTPNDPIPKAKLLVVIILLALWAVSVAQTLFLMHRQHLLEQRVADSLSAYASVLETLHTRQTITEDILKMQYDMNKYAQDAVVYNKTKPKRGSTQFVGVGGFPDYGVSRF